MWIVFMNVNLMKSLVWNQMSDFNKEDLVCRLRKREEIRRQIITRQNVEESTKISLKRQILGH